MQHVAIASYLICETSPFSKFIYYFSASSNFHKISSAVLVNYDTPVMFQLMNASIDNINRHLIFQHILPARNFDVR